MTASASTPSPSTPSTSRFAAPSPRPRHTLAAPSLRPPLTPLPPSSPPSPPPSPPPRSPPPPLLPVAPPIAPSLHRCVLDPRRALALDLRRLDRCALALNRCSRLRSTPAVRSRSRSTAAARSHHSGGPDRVAHSCCVFVACYRELVSCVHYYRVPAAPSPSVHERNGTLAVGWPLVFTPLCSPPSALSWLVREQIE